MKNKNKHKQDITPASHGDELDVLEALAEVSKKSDTNFLSKNQLSILEKSGRQAWKNKGFRGAAEKGLFGDQDTLVADYNDLPLITKARLVVSMLGISMKNNNKKLFSGDSYEVLSEEEKIRFFDYMFRAFYGYTPAYAVLKIAALMNTK